MAPRHCRPAGGYRSLRELSCLLAVFAASGCAVPPKIPEGAMEASTCVADILRQTPSLARVVARTNARGDPVVDIRDTSKPPATSALLFRKDPDMSGFWVFDINGAYFGSEPKPPLAMDDETKLKARCYAVKGDVNVIKIVVNPRDLDAVLK